MIDECMTENFTRQGEEKLDVLSMRKPSNLEGFLEGVIENRSE
jgi:hypothetical protein